eukprot:3188007-Rhodomonas_salina.4
MTWTDLSSAVSGAIPVSAHLTATMGRLYVSDGEDPDSRAHRSNKPIAVCVRSWGRGCAPPGGRHSVMSWRRPRAGVDNCAGV